MYAPILQQVKETVERIQPGAELWLYGSFARGEAHAESDLDLLILTEGDSLNSHLKKALLSALYGIELETGQIISPVIRSKTAWLHPPVSTPFHENVTREAIRI